MPPSAAFCPACRRSAKSLSPAERLAAAAAYLSFVPAAILLFLPAFRGNRFVRFHAWQSVLLWGAFALGTVIAPFLSERGAAIFFLLLGVLAVLAMFFLWAVLSIKARQGEWFELPLLGKLAGRLR